MGLGRSLSNSSMGDLPEGTQIPGESQPLAMTKHSLLTGPDHETIKEEGGGKEELTLTGPVPGAGSRYGGYMAMSPCVSLPRCKLASVPFLFS